MKTLVVVGLGPVGLTLAVAAGVNHPELKIIGLDKNLAVVEQLNRGESHLKTNDHEFHSLLDTIRLEKRFLATSNSKVISEADVVLLAVGPTVSDQHIDTNSFFQAVDDIARLARPNSLLIVASTLPVGTMQLILPKLEHLQVAYAFERITPGGNMLNSASEGRKIIAAKNIASYEAARAFFKFSDAVFVSFTEAEMTKLMENSYRAANIALIHEWTLLAESLGLNLFSIIDSIRSRVGTHDNIRTPGPGIGGPCLLKDSMIAILNGQGIDMPFLKLALQTSRQMDQHIAHLIGEVDSLGILGLAYRADVSDVRNSPAVNVMGLVRAKKIYGHDALVSSEDCPQAMMLSSFADFLERINVLVVFHPLTNEMTSQLISHKLKIKIVDTSNNISDELAQKLHLNGAQLVGVGKGHWKAKFGVI